MGEPTFVPGPEIARAVAFAAEHHGDQTRKGSSTPYLQHLLGVAAIAMELGATETETVAAVLHDVLEDTEVTETDLRVAFGDDVSDIVAACSAEAKGAEDPVESWKARKRAYLYHLGRASPSAVLVSLADKIHNARSIATDHRRDGDAIWTRFNASRADQVWYYDALVGMYTRRAQETGGRISADMVDELRLAVESFRDRSG